MKILFDFFPVLLFFVSYKFFGIYVATAIAIGSSILQVSIYWIRHRKLERMHLVTLLLIVVLGGATLFFHDEVFIKWKPTALNWAFAVTFLTSQFLAQKPLIQTMMEEAHVELPATVWRRLNMSWVVFFILIGCANLGVAYNFDTDTWVNFKLFGVLGLTLLFVVLQAVYLTRHINEDEQLNSHKSS